MELTQREAADMIGVDFVQWSKFECGAVKPGRKNAAAIAALTKGDVYLESWDENSAAARKAS